MEKVFITINDYQRLTGLIAIASLKEKMPDLVDRLHSKLSNAQMLPQNNILDSVITMNSRVLVKDLSHGRVAEITVSYPQDADGREGRVSVFSPIGITLLGCQVGDQVSWRVPAGVRHFEVVKILYQPEALGHYHL